MSTTKLDWDYEPADNSHQSHYKGLRICAVHDAHPENPFAMLDGHWPMVTYHDRSFTDYDTRPGAGLFRPFERFTPELLVHLQKHIAKELSYDGVEGVRNILDAYVSHDLDETPNYCFDADLLLTAFEQAFDDVSNQTKFNVCEELYRLLGIPCLNTTSRGYSQGDYTEILIVATPEAQAAIRPQPADMDDATWAKTLDEDMNAQADLYGAWAWGDVYGFTVEKRVRLPDEDADDEAEWEEVEDGSCWGFYGDDFAKSGLDEAAIDAAEAYLRRAKRSRESKLKALIINRTPLDRRARILEETL